MTRDEVEVYRKLVARELARMKNEARNAGLTRQEFVLERLKKEIQRTRPFTKWLLTGRGRGASEMTTIL